MKIEGIGLAAALLLCSMTVGYAQGGPPDKEQKMEAPSRGGDGGAQSPDESKGGGAAMKEDRDSQKSDRRSAGGEQRDQPTSKREAREEKGGGQPDKKAASEKATKPSGKQAETRDDATKAKDEAQKPEKAETGTGQEPAKEQQAEDKSKDAGKQAKLDKAKQVDLSGDKRDKVRSAFRGLSNVKHETKIEVDVSVGTRLPGHLHFQPLPVAVIEIVPEYRGFVFVYVDDRYVICDPNTYEVVAIIDEGGEGGYRTTAARDGVGECSTNLTLTRDERELLLNSIEIKGEQTDVDDLSIGFTVPQSVDLSPLPDRVLSRVDKLKGCQYFVAEDQIALVNPDDDKVVLLVEAND